MNRNSALEGLARLSRVITLGLTFGISSLALAASDPWLQLGPFGPGNFESVAVHPNDPLTVYASGPAGILRTVDGGASWAILEPTLLGFRQDPSSRPIDTLL